MFQSHLRSSHASATLRKPPNGVRSCRSALSRGSPTLGQRRCNVSLADAKSGSPEVTSFRKELKDAKKRQNNTKQTSAGSAALAAARDRWELTVGLEIHAQLNTDRKLFSGAATSDSDGPNAHVALFDVAIPGSQPIFQKETLIPALRAAIAFNCQISPRSSFDRKHYFYSDQPAGYQITQYYEPFARDGSLQLYDHDGIAREDGESITIGIKQIQMEQDTARTWHQSPTTRLLDFNRVSHPLIEIITLPQIHHPATAAACVKKIQSILSAVNACILGMEIGGLRADVNVSVKPKSSMGSSGSNFEYYGVTGLGQRTEIKNLSSFKAVEDAIKSERDRQIAVLEQGGVIEGETRSWTLGGTDTKRLRGKEGEVDYRYMPDPDLGTVVLGEDLIEHLEETLPLLPDQQLQLLTTSPEYNLTSTDAKTLISLDGGQRLDYYFRVVELVTDGLERARDGKVNALDEKNVRKIGRTTSNWVLHELGALLSTDGRAWTDNLVTEEALADILALLLQGKITGKTGKYLLSVAFGGQAQTIAEVVAEQNLLLIPMSNEEYEALARQVMENSPKIVEEIRSGGKNMGKIKFLVGQMMREGEEGNVEAKRAEDTLRKVLAP
ncbi:MAG: hypothetical protein M4579_006606 [Chaenotheca gracillima]|nr:MAG: hypothetical protein M4579_006606 [Chaenotheca gracillima]